STGKKTKKAGPVGGCHGGPLGYPGELATRPAEAVLQASGPTRDRLRGVRQHTRLKLLRASDLQTEIMLPVRPVDADQGCEAMFGGKLHRSPPRALHCRRDMHSWALRSQYREPVRRQA